MNLAGPDYFRETRYEEDHPTIYDLWDGEKYVAEFDSQDVNLWWRESQNPYLVDVELEVYITLLDTPWGDGYFTMTGDTGEASVMWGVGYSPGDYVIRISGEGVGQMMELTLGAYLYAPFHITQLKEAGGDVFWTNFRSQYEVT